MTRAEFHVWVTKMTVVFKDANVWDVASGFAIFIPLLPADNPPFRRKQLRRALFILCNHIVFSLIMLGLTYENGGIVAVSGAPEDDGAALWAKSRLSYRAFFSMLWSFAKSVHSP